MIFYVDDCEQKIGYSFKNKNLLRQCFTHASYSHEHKNEPSNERLEFFGDAILEYCISEYLYEKYPDCDVDFHFGGQPVYYYIISLE